MKKILVLAIIVFGVFFLGACSRSTVSMTPPSPVMSVPTQTQNEPSPWEDVESISGKNPANDAAFFKAKEKFVAELIQNDEFAFCGDINDQESFGKWYQEAMAPHGGGIWWPKESPKGRETDFAGRKAIAFPASSIVSYYDGSENLAVKEKKEPKVCKEKMQAAFGCADFPVYPGRIIKVDDSSKFPWKAIGAIKYNPEITTDLNANPGDKVLIYCPDGHWREETLISQDDKSVTVGIFGAGSGRIEDYSYFVGLGSADKFVPAKVSSWRTSKTDEYSTELRFEIVDPTEWERADWRYLKPNAQLSFQPEKGDSATIEIGDRKLPGTFERQTAWQGDKFTFAIRVSFDLDVPELGSELKVSIGGNEYRGILGSVTQDNTITRILSITVKEKVEVQQ